MEALHSPQEVATFSASPIGWVSPRFNTLRRISSLSQLTLFWVSISNITNWQDIEKMSHTVRRERKEAALEILVKQGAKPIDSAVPALTIFQLLVIACNYLNPQDPQKAYRQLYLQLDRMRAGVRLTIRQGDNHSAGSQLAGESFGAGAELPDLEPPGPAAEDGTRGCR